MRIIQENSIINSTFQFRRKQSIVRADSNLKEISSNKSLESNLNKQTTGNFKSLKDSKISEERI